jgi:hypothetical protein
MHDSFSVFRVFRVFRGWTLFADMNRSLAEPDAAANAGRPSRLHSNAVAPAWLRFAFGRFTACTVSTK